MQSRSTYLYLGTDPKCKLFPSLEIHGMTYFLFWFSGGISPIVRDFISIQASAGSNETLVIATQSLHSLMYPEHEELRLSGVNFECLPYVNNFVSDVSRKKEKFSHCSSTELNLLCGHKWRCLTDLLQPRKSLWKRQRKGKITVQVDPKNIFQWKRHFKQRHTQSSVA